MAQALPTDLFEWADEIVVSSSGGIDSQAILVIAARLAKGRKLHVVHADMREQEHTSAASCNVEPQDGFDGRGAEELVEAQAKLANAELHVVRRNAADGVNHSLNQQVLQKRTWSRVGMGPCQGTSDHKRGPIWTVYTKLAKRIARSDRPVRILEIRGEARHEGGCGGKRDKRLRKLAIASEGGRVERHVRCSNSRREVVTWYPLADLPQDAIWQLVREAAARNETTLPAWTYGFRMQDGREYGLPRFSCAVCVFARRPVLQVVAELRPKLFTDMVQIEDTIQKPFRQEFSLRGIQDDVKAGVRVSAEELANGWDDQA